MADIPDRSRFSRSSHSRTCRRHSWMPARQCSDFHSVINGIRAAPPWLSPLPGKRPIISSATRAMAMSRIEVFFTPAEFQTLRQRDLSQASCAVFDILRATSTMVNALQKGAAAMIPVANIEEALRLKRERPELLLAGERGGHRIRVNGEAFD